MSNFKDESKEFFAHLSLLPEQCVPLTPGGVKGAAVFGISSHHVPFFMFSTGKTFFFFKLAYKVAGFFVALTYILSFGSHSPYLIFLPPVHLSPPHPSTVTCTCIANVFYYPPHLPPLEVTSPSLGPLSRFLAFTILTATNTHIKTLKLRERTCSVAVWARIPLFYRMSGC